MKKLSAMCLAALLLVALTELAWGDYWAGVQAATESDYATAYKEWRPLAEQGDARAQYSLGFMYSQGISVTQDYKKAYYWFNKSAQQGYALGWAKLGLIFELGRGVPTDYVKAYAWYDLAAAQGWKSASDSREEIAKKMTPAQIAEGERLASEWRPWKPKK